MEGTYSGDLVRPVLDFFKYKSTSKMKNLQWNIPQSSSTFLATIFKDMTEMLMARSSLLHRELRPPSFTKLVMMRRTAETTFKLIRTRLYPYFVVYTCCIQCQPQLHLLALTSALNTAGSSFSIPCSTARRHDPISTLISHQPSSRQSSGPAPAIPRFSHGSNTPNPRHNLG